MKTYAFSIAVPGLKLDYGNKPLEEMQVAARWNARRPSYAAGCRPAAQHDEPARNGRGRPAQPGDDRRLRHDPAGLGARWDETEAITLRLVLAHEQGFLLGRNIAIPR